jgi:hypothetical protein
METVFILFAVTQHKHDGHAPLSTFRFQQDGGGVECFFFFFFFEIEFFR